MTRPRRVKRSEASFSAARISRAVGGLLTCVVGLAPGLEVGFAAAREAMRDCLALSGCRVRERLR